MSEAQQQEGISALSKQLARAGLQILASERPWPNRRVTYFEIGKPNQQTDIVLSDEFVRDLPRTREYQAAVDSYASAVAGRIRCGSPNLFYCLSHAAISVGIRWPLESALVGGVLSTWLLLHVTNEKNRLLARCCLDVERRVSYTGRTTFDDLRSAINRTRLAIDDGRVKFYEPRSHPESYQKVEVDAEPPPAQRDSLETARFIAGKTYMLAFQILDIPGEAWIADPWDAEYLGISPRELSQSAYVARARGLIELDASLSLARPSDKLVVAGWPATMGENEVVHAAQVFTLASLPKKEDLSTDLKNSLAQQSEIAVVFVDLDNFKQVNDTHGHSTGDACLEAVIKAIGSVLGSKGKGTLYRWGGDEFAVTLPHFATQEAVATAERIRKAIEEAKAGGDIPVTASVGVCAADRVQTQTAEALLDCADKAMYASKKNGKNRVTSWPF